MIQLESVRSPFVTPVLVQSAVSALARIDAMGLLPKEEVIRTLDLHAMRKVMSHVHRAGIGRTINAGLSDELGRNHAALESLLQQLNNALEDSPVPEYEWNSVMETLGTEVLAPLLGVSAVSVRRYGSAARTTPDAVAARLHFLALVVGDLLGAYNEAGVRQWFHRKRAQLGGKTPVDLLKGEWKPDGTGAARVRALARSLSGASAT